ncbi:MAG: LuxR family transcriptional regulator [Pseudomonadota bacterium]
MDFGPLAQGAGVFDLIATRLGRAESEMEMLTDVMEFFSSCGMRLISFHHLPPPGAIDYTNQLTIVARGFPKEWVARYESELYRIDPIPRRALNSTHPFFWSEAKDFAGLTKEELYYLSELDAQNLGDGLAIPVFGPHGRSGYVGLGFGPDATNPPPETVGLLHAICQVGHLQYCRMLYEDTRSKARLSPREVEILRWISRGKSNAVIAEVLNISENTVDTHLRRAFSKLNVHDRVTAALRGVALGVL